MDISNYSNHYILSLKCYSNSSFPNQGHSQVVGNRYEAPFIFSVLSVYLLETFSSQPHPVTMDTLFVEECILISFQ